MQMTMPMQQLPPGVVMSAVPQVQLFTFFCLNFSIVTIAHLALPNAHGRSARLCHHGSCAADDARPSNGPPRRPRDAQQSEWYVIVRHERLCSP